MSTPTAQPLLREFIQIPKEVSDDDFVLKLAEGVADVQATLREYVITDALLDNFDQALGLIQAAVTGRSSKAAYLHGSFGSGKSHFMAVLHALLRGEPAARRQDEFAGLLAKHEWMTGRKFLLVPYHLLGAKSLEQRVLGNYVDYVRTLHPDAPIPAVHRTDALLDNTRHLREQIGDERFIAGLPGGDTEDEWGEERPYWTSDKLDVAFAASMGRDRDDEGHRIELRPEDKLRRKLVNDLLQTWGQGFFTNAKEDADGFISLDAGLGEISRHAKELGYDALILFLDELILWLANSIGDQQFVSREIQKITNFVESGDAARAIPVVSFIARQRDLRELVGEEVTGTVELSFQDTLDLASARFNTITLEDRNLPVIARERVLRRTNRATADDEIGRAFDATTKLRRDVWDFLLGAGGGTGADIDAFRKTYPFSPAFMDTLVHVSSVLQRSRTALKLMRKILVQRRDDLRLGQLIPLGDLYDVLSEGGDEPFTQRLKVEFDAAQKLYAVKLRPHLLDDHGLADDEIARVRRGGEVDATTAAKVRAFTADDRLIKTLLLSALAPTVPALHNLTVRKLSALNYGSFISPIQGGEVDQVARKVENWAARFTEVNYEKGDDPAVGLELVGIDIDSILENARLAGADSWGTRKNQIRKLLYAEMGIVETGRYGGDQFDLLWRGSKRSIEVVFGNVRDENDLREGAFQPADPAGWRVVLDYPFDEGDFTPADDRNRVQRLRSKGLRSRTVCWIPAALSAERFNDLRQLVTIDYVLQGQRFEEHAQHLNPTDRHRARQTLTGHRDVLRGKLIDTLRQAYGLITKQPGDVNPSYDDHLLALHDDLRPKLAMGGALAEALRSVAEQMMACQFPAHPDFDPDRSGAIVRPADARTVLEYVRKAVESDEGRVEVDRPHRIVLRRIANPLRLGEMHEAAFLLGSHWRQHFHQRAAQHGITGDLELKDLLEWLDQPTPMGLDRLVANLVIACFAEQTDRAWVQHGGPLNPPPELTRIQDNMALREEDLPDQQTWETARKRAMDVFGHNPPKPRRTRLAAMFARQLSDDARRYRDAAHNLVVALEVHGDVLGLELTTNTGRLHTARCARDLLDGLGSHHNRLDIIEQLARADLGGPAQRAGKSIKSADDVVRALTGAAWDNLTTIADLPEPHKAEADQIFERLREAATADELTTQLGPALRRAGEDATALLRKAIKIPAPDPGPDPDPGPGPRTADIAFRESVLVDEADLILGRLRDEVQRLLRDKPGASIEITLRVIE
jgi:hypothetical protein